MDHAEIARALFEALSSRDDQRVRTLCAADFTFRQNGGEPMGLDSLLKFNALVHGIATGFHYAHPVRAATATGFVEEHVVRASLTGGGAIDFAVCVVADVKDGKVSDVREYVDTAAAAPLIAALSQSR